MKEIEFNRILLFIIHITTKLHNENKQKVTYISDKKLGLTFKFELKLVSDSLKFSFFF